MKNINNKPRVTVRWNTGSRVHKPKKGKGSYTRRISPDTKHKSQ